ncbi:hypothetical protein MSG28_009620 [Choristoneura fumiferana]|uniref:Uncharacterized protein n=1 Tax=Choristoneura fumiferana TaxID=7141 RepID=A0ACC0JBV2_CHOFU|nr:hypothetical protein MSG28_009620 [Choristoneura fumiferana]
MNLSKSEVLDMIEEYQKHRALWDSNHKGHFNKYIKNTAWQEIAETFGVDVTDARRKMASLLGSFRREKAKMKMAQANDSLSDYQSDWFAFNKLKFLLGINDQKSLHSEEENECYDDECDYTEIHLIIPKTESNTEEFEEGFKNDTTDIDDILEPNPAAILEPNPAGLHGPNSTGSLEPNPTAFVEPTPPIKRPRLSSTLYENTNQELRVKKEGDLKAYTIPSDQEKRDVTSKFVGYLEAKLNQYDPTTNAILIHKINQLIFETDMSTISKSNASYSLSSTSPRSCYSPNTPFNSNTQNGVPRTHVVFIRGTTSQEAWRPNI